MSWKQGSSSWICQVVILWDDNKITIELHKFSSLRENGHGKLNIFNSVHALSAYLFLAGPILSIS